MLETHVYVYFGCIVYCSPSLMPTLLIRIAHNPHFFNHYFYFIIIFYPSAMELRIFAHQHFLFKMDQDLSYMCLKIILFVQCLLFTTGTKSIMRERSGSVIECLTRGRGAAGSSPTGVTVLCH